MKHLKIVLLIGVLLVAFWGCSSNKEADKEQIISPDELYVKGNQQFTAGQYQEALKTYQSLLDNFPTSDLHIDTQLKMASVYGHLEDFEQQMAILSRLLKENIIPGRIPQIYVQIGKFYEKAATFNPGLVTSDTSDYEKAIKYYKRAVFYKDSKDTLAKAEAAYRQAVCEVKIGKINEAVTDYGFVKNYFPHTPFALLAQIKLKDPADTTELTTDEAALEKYKQQLQEEASMENVAPQPSAAPAHADSLFQIAPSDSGGAPADTSGGQE